MPFDLSQALRIKGMLDAVIKAAPEDPLTATQALVEAYRSTREVCLHLVADTDVAAEFQALFPLIEPEPPPDRRRDPIATAAAGERARLLLAQLSGWLGSWPSAEALLDELVTALESAEAQTDEPKEKARLAGIREG